MARRHSKQNSTSFRTARVGELIRRIIAESVEKIDDSRLALVSFTNVHVDRDLHRAVVWFTTLYQEDDEDLVAMLNGYAPRLRRAVARQAHLRKTPELVFRADEVLRAAERIEMLIAESAEPAEPEIAESAEPESVEPAEPAEIEVAESESVR